MIKDDKHWNDFERSGSIISYLNYKGVDMSASKHTEENADAHKNRRHSNKGNEPK